jgi:hypothetical protein
MCRASDPHAEGRRPRRAAIIAGAVHLLTAPGASTIAPAAASAAPILGFGDQNAATFADHRFGALHIHQTRYYVRWDAFRHADEVAAMDAWMAAARARHTDPLISFGHSRHTRTMPTPGYLAAVLRAIRKRYPWVHQFATWNEVNLRYEHLHRDPRRVVAYYRALRRACRSCTVLIAELVDTRNVFAYAAKLERYAGRRSSTIWGLHNYVDVNYFLTSRTRRFLRTIAGRVWLTETGGIVHRRKNGRNRYTARRALKANRWLLEAILPLSSTRIRRVYLYEWRAMTRHDRWDTALIDCRGKARPSYRYLRDLVTTRRIRTGPRLSAHA